MCTVLSHKFGVVQAQRTSSNPLKQQALRQSRALSYKFGVVQAHRTSSNPLKTHEIRKSEVCRALSEKFGVVQAHRTSSNPLKTHAFRESKVCRVCHMFAVLEPPRTDVTKLYTPCSLQLSTILCLSPFLLQLRERHLHTLPLLLKAAERLALVCRCESSVVCA